MAFPWILESTFELGTNAEWTSESDTGSRLDFPHYSTLAGLAIGPAAPYRGAYCARIELGDTNDHTLVSTTIVQAAANTSWYRFYLYLGTNVAATADDTFPLFELQSGAGPFVVEAAVGLRITAATGAIEIGVGETVPATFATDTLTRGRWYAIELQSLLDSGPNDGQLTLYVDGIQVAQTAATLDQAVITQGVLGSQDTLATTTGTLLFDQVLMDDARIYPERTRFPRDRVFTASGHAFVGPGTVDTAVLLSTTTGNILRLFDTDTANVLDAQALVVELDLTAHTAVDGPLRFERGCYVQLTGTNARGQVSLDLGPAGPTYYSAAGMRRYGLARRSRPNNV